jgi:hypothetical protein
VIGVRIEGDGITRRELRRRVGMIEESQKGFLSPGHIGTPSTPPKIPGAAPYPQTDMGGTLVKGEPSAPSSALTTLPVQSRIERSETETGLRRGRIYPIKKRLNNQLRERGAATQMEIVNESG